MKNLNWIMIGILGAFAVGNAAFAGVPLTKKIKLGSPMNFNGHSLTIDPKANGEVEVLIGNNMFLWNGAETDNHIDEYLRKLASVLGEEDITGLSLTFAAGKCQALPTNDNVVACVQNDGDPDSNFVRIRAVKIDWRGNIIQVGAQEVTTRTSGVLLSEITESTVSGPSTSGKVKIWMDIPAGAHGLIYLELGRDELNVIH